MCVAFEGTKIDDDVSVGETKKGAQLEGKNEGEKKGSR